MDSTKSLPIHIILLLKFYHFASGKPFRPNNFIVYVPWFMSFDCCPNGRCNGQCVSRNLSRFQQIVLIKPHGQSPRFKALALSNALGPAYPRTDENKASIQPVPDSNEPSLTNRLWPLFREGYIKVIHVAMASFMNWYGTYHPGFSNQLYRNDKMNSPAWFHPVVFVPE